MTDLVMGLIVGFVVGSVLLSVLMYVAVGRVRQSLAARAQTQDETIADLRQERAEDKETNRRLRHELHSLSSGYPPAPAVAEQPHVSTDVELEIDAARAERDDALEQLADAQRSLESARARLADREAKLREYRDALKEIRLSLEAQDGLRGIITITEDVPANVQAAD